MRKTNIENKRAQFERLKEVKKRIGHLHPTIIWFGDDGLYHTSFNLQDDVNWLNGAFYAFGKSYRSLKEAQNESKHANDAKGWDTAREAMFRPYKEK